MSAIGNGASKQIQDQISSLGTNQLTIFPGSANVGGVRGGFGSAPPLTEKDLVAVRDRVSSVVAASGRIQANVSVVFGSANWATQVQGVSADYEQVQSWPVVKGRFFDSREAQSGGKVAVIGATVARELFAGADPLGSIVRINNSPFTVIGVLSEKGQAAARTRTTRYWCPSPPHVRGWRAASARPTRSGPCW